VSLEVALFVVPAHHPDDCNLAEARLLPSEHCRPSHTDMRGVRRATLFQEGGPWGKHGFPHEASAQEAREAV
jgi:hypothetical protein